MFILFMFIQFFSQWMGGESVFFFLLSLTSTEVLSVTVPGDCCLQGRLDYLLGPHLTRHLPQTCLLLMGLTIT